MSEIKVGDEVEVVDEIGARDYSVPRDSARMGRRFRVGYVAPDGSIRDGPHGYFFPPGTLALVHDVTAPEPALVPIKDKGGNVLLPNPKAAFGAQKPNLALIPPVALHHAAMAHENGAGKYGAYNWRQNAVEAMTYVAAAQRHLADWLDGAECSGDTNPPVHNLGHVIACCAILLDAQEQGNLIDNRPPDGASAQVLERMKAAKIEAAK